MQLCRQRLPRRTCATCPVSGRHAVPRARAAGLTCRSQVDTKETVDSVLSLIESTDGGINMAPSTRQEVDNLLDQLEQVGAAQQPRPLQDPLLWGNYNVAYTSTARAPSERGQPAGGRFRGRIGRTLFQTAGLYQSVLEPDIATNKVAFNLFGLLPGFVGLRGKLVPVGDTGDTVRVLFEPPVLSLGECVHLRIGPPSSVQLTTTYLDERIRLGKGSRGSLFVFTRGGAADAADMASVGLQKTAPAAQALLWGVLTMLMLGGLGLWNTGALAAKVSAGVIWGVSGLLALVVRQGGIIRDDADIEAAEQRWRQQQQQQDQQQQQQQDQQQPTGASSTDQQASQQAAAAAAVVVAGQA